MNINPLRDVANFIQDADEVFFSGLAYPSFICVYLIVLAATNFLLLAQGNSPLNLPRLC